MISAVITTYNETEQLRNCLESLRGFADELVIVDLGSTDKLKSIASEFGARVYEHKFVPFVEKVRNYAVSKACGDWILVLDPDEVMGDILKNKLKFIASEGKYQAVNIPRKNIFFDKWIAYTNWWPDKHVRFFKKGSVLWSERIHHYPKVSGKVLNLDAEENLAIRHFGYRSISEFLKRQNRYSTIETENLFYSGRKFSWINLFYKPAREFLVRFIRHAGFLDGFYGFALTFLMMVNQLTIAVKLWELEQNK